MLGTSPRAGSAKSESRMVHILSPAGRGSGGTQIPGMEDDTTCGAAWICAFLVRNTLRGRPSARDPPPGRAGQTEMTAWHTPRNDRDVMVDGASEKVNPP